MTTTITSRGRTPFWNAVGIVAQRELLVHLRSKAFLISTAILFVAVAASVVIGGMAGSLFQSTTTVAATSQTAPLIEGLPDTEVVTVGDADEATALVESGDADAAVLPGDGPSGLLVVGERGVPGGLVQALSLPPEVELLDPDSVDPMIAYFVGLGFGLIFFMSAMTFGTAIANSVVEEKQTRIVEILLATIPARAILAGKILGNSILAFGQIAIISLIVIAAGGATGMNDILGPLTEPILWFIALFTVGFVMIASLYAATAALVSRTEDLGSATTPVMMLVMIPYILVIIFNNNPTALQIMSYVPFSAPVAVPMRVFLGTSEWWEPLVSLAIMAATTVAIILVSARIYEGGLLRTGKKISISQALKG